MICQSSYVNEESNLLFVPEIAFEIVEGIGIFNFGAGKICQLICGKSQLMNDLLFPSGTFLHQAFEENDINIFSSGQIDVFFEKSFDVKRKMVVMDGQGCLNDKSIKSVLNLTNIVIINFNYQEINDGEALYDLNSKIKMIKSNDSNIYIILVLRDSPDSKLYQEQISDFLKNKQNHQMKEQIEYIQNNINSCIKLKNMSTLNKTSRIKQMSPILKTFYQTIEDFQSQTHKFTRKNFIEKFLIQDELNQYQTKTVLDVIKQSNHFVEKVQLIKQNIYQDDALSILNVKKLIRQQILEIRNKISLKGQEQETLEEEMTTNLEKLFDYLKVIKPTNILKEFHEIILDKNGYCSLILYEISKKLREITAQQLDDPIKQKEKLSKTQNEQISKQKQANNDEKEVRLQEFKDELDKIQNEIHKKSISLELFWRCLIFYMGKETDCKDFSDQFERQQILKSIDGLLKNGDCQELIDGENLEFKGQFIKEVIDSSKKDKVIVVCVIGPQSSGKSTLMNFAFGTQFFTSTGRCTKGIYFTLQKFPYDNNAKVKWLLMLDTEGLQSPEKIDDEYDRKIVIFAMLSANLLIINNRGEISSQMINTLKMCCLTFDLLKKFGYSPQIIYTYGQNDQKDQRPFIDQVINIKNDVIQASNSPTIEKTAEEVLGFSDEKINVFGYAYHCQVFEKDLSKGLKQDINFKVGVTNFGVQTSIIFKKVCELVDKKAYDFNEISKWQEDAKQNWNLIDRYSGDINAFKNLDEYSNDKKVQKIMLQFWSDYLNKYNPVENDKIKAEVETIRLVEIFKISSKQILDSEIIKVEYKNSTEKDEMLNQHIFDKLEDWRKLPAQKHVTGSSLDKYKKNIEAKMDVIKNEFKMTLGAKIKEEQLKWMYKIGIKRFIDRAIEIQREVHFNQMSTEEQDEYIKKQFQISWNAQIEEMQNQAKINEMKETYFDDLLKTFKSVQRFMKDVNKTQFNQLIERIQPYLNNQQDDGQIQQNKQKSLQDFIVQELKSLDLKENKMFASGNLLIQQLINDPIQRIFDKNKPEEQFLKLKELINFDYVYDVITSLNDLDRKYLEQDILKNLQKKKLEAQQIYKQNLRGNSLQNQIIKDVMDKNYQITYLRDLFYDLSQAGFNFSQKYNFILFNITIQKSLRDRDVEQLYQTCFFVENQQGIDIEQKKLEQKQQWAKKFSNELEFDEKSFVSFQKSIEKFFHKKKQTVHNRQSPHESLQDHIELQKYIDPSNNILDSLIEPTCEIKCVQSNKAKQNKITKQQFETLINPQNNKYEMVSTENNLSYIANSQLDWNQIAKMILEYVQIVLNSNKIDDQQKDINIDKMMEINNMSSHQVQKLENEYLNKLRNAIEDELKSKLGIGLSKEMESQISWCALIICWVEFFQKAEKSFNIQLSNFQKQYDKEYEKFKLIAQGNINSITNESIQSLINKVFDDFENKLKIKYQMLIINDLHQIQDDFNSQKIYQELDDFYLAFGKQYEVDALYKYVEDPIQIFKEKVNELKQIKIDNQIISQYDSQIRLKLIENLQAFLKLMQEIQYQLINEKNKWETTENYFKIVDDQNKELDFNEKQGLIQQISPVIYYVLIKILEGEFNMDQIEFHSNDEFGNEQIINYLTLTNQQGFESNYYFTPQISSEEGPLEIFSQPQFLGKIKNLHQTLKKKDLINEVINTLKKQQFSKDQDKIFQIDIIIDSSIRYVQKQIELLKNKVFDAQYFNQDGGVNELCEKAIGCTFQCKFCRRKCELDSKHGIDEQKHHCDNVGHQLRVFAGGHFLNKYTGKKYPSKGTCDTIDKDQFIYLNGTRFTWNEIVNAQMSDWNIDFDQQNMNSKKTHILFQDFWKQVGPQYCQKNQMQYIENQEELDQLQQDKLIDPELVIFALDESTSMRGDKWINGVNGAKKYIEFLNENHLKPQTVQLIIIFFNKTARIAYNDILQYPLPENIWKMNGGGTFFDKPIELAFQEIQNHIDTKKMVRFNFYTDGQAEYPKDIFIKIGQLFQDKKDKYLNNGKPKLKILLMCEEEQNKVMELMKKKFNEICLTHFNNDEVCQLEKEVLTEEIGQVMIESFSINN